mgnify:CR=1 FL=1
MRNTKIRLLAEAAVMLALAIALSYIKIWDMPMGGSVTLLSMLPIILIAVKNGTGWGVGTAFVFSLFQLLQGVMSGNVFPYCQTLAIVILCVAFDYIVPFTVLGFAAVGKKKFGMAGSSRSALSAFSATTSPVCSSGDSGRPKAWQKRSTPCSTTVSTCCPRRF